MRRRRRYHLCWNFTFSSAISASRCRSKWDAAGHPPNELHELRALAITEIYLDIIEAVADEYCANIVGIAP